MTTKADYIRSDELADAAVRVTDLAKLYGVSRATIYNWIEEDQIATFVYPGWDGTRRPPTAVRWGDIPVGQPGATRWHPREA